MDENEDLKKEIDSAVSDVVEKKAQDVDVSDIPDGSDVPPDKDASGDVGDDKSPSDGGKDGEDKPARDGDLPDDITDDHLERAVKAGIDIKTARAFKSAEALDRVVSLLDDRQKDKGAADKKEDAKESDDPLAGIPDLDPEEYDQAIVDGFKAMKAIIRSQHEAIQGFNKNGEPSWIESQISELGVQATADQTAALKKKFDVLSAGYKASGDNVSKEDVFSEVAKMVLGGEIAASKEKDLAAKLVSRSNLHTSRPSGKGLKAKGDPLQDIAAEIDAKHFK